MDIRTLCLGLLALRDASGYEIKKAFEGELSHFYEASFGSIYPALTRLTREGLVTCTEQAQEKRPDKKVYRITPAGRLVFHDALASRPGRDHVRSDFLATLMFADLLTTRHLAELIDARLAEYRQALTAMRAQNTRRALPGERFVHGYGIAQLEAALSYIEENRHLVESAGLVSREASRR